MRCRARLTSFSHTLWCTALLWLIAGTAAVFAADLLADRLLDIRTGLKAIYFSAPGWQDRDASLSVVDGIPSTSALKQRRPDFADRPFSVEWRGVIVVPESATYRFATVSDDGSWLYVRGTEVVANGGVHPPVEASGSMALEAGVHPIFIRYFQARGDCSFELLWAREGRALEPVPARALLTDAVSYGRLVTHRAIGLAMIVVPIAWYLFLGAAFVTWTLAAAGRLLRLPHGGLDPALGSVLLLSVLLNAWGIWWAMPNSRGWAPDELVPSDAFKGLLQLFSHGWYDKYPPLHYAVLSAAGAPVLFLSSLGLVDLQMAVPYVRATPSYVALVLIGRLVSLALGAATVGVVYRCGLELCGRRGAAFAALTTALMVPFAYYSKMANLDVPYLFWFAVSLFAYIRIVKRHDRRDYLLFAASAALAVCTKDQAYGLYVLTAPAILVARWHRWRKVGGPVVQVLVDRTTMLAAGVAAGIFIVADNLVFNFSGFVEHVRVLVGPASSSYQMFPGTAAGQIQMAWAAMRELRYMFGWPLVTIVAVGVVRGMGGSTAGPLLRWLAVPAVSYYAVFIGVVLYFFDRFLMPIGLVLSLFAGCWLEQFLAPAVRARRVRLALVAAAFAYSVVYVAAVDYALTSDSRYAATRWMRARVGPNQVIGSLGPIEYVMLADRFAWQPIETVEDVAATQPKFIVLDTEAVARLPTFHPGRAMRAALLDGRAGYRLALRFRSPSVPLPGRHPDLGDRRRNTPQMSTLSMINPTMEIFERPGS